MDPRVARSTHALGQALIELIQEGDYDSITVQRILDRAGIGRATFYAHYRNKEDVLYSSYERLFSGLERLVERPSAVGHRLFPVSEFLEHLASARSLLDALRSSGQLDVMWPMFVEFAARMIERRLGAQTRAAPRPLVARMLAGALAESVAWWLDHQNAATPAQVDSAFHDLASRARRSV